MPHPCPHHCPPGRSGGAAVLVVLAVVVIAAIARPVVHAAEVALEVAAIVLGCAAALAVAAGVAYTAWRVHRWQARNRQAIPNHAPTAQPLSGPRRPAIEVPRRVIEGIVIRDDTRDRRHP